MKRLALTILEGQAASKQGEWQQLENARQMLCRATSDDFEINVDRYMFAENPIITLKKPDNM